MMNKKIIYLIGLVLIFVFNQSYAQQLEWANTFGSTEWDEGRSITTDSQGNVYITGVFTDTVDFDPSNNTFNLITQPGVSDVFVSKLNSVGEFVWAISFEGTSYAEGNDIDIDDQGNVFVTGSFEDTVDFDPGASVFELVTPGHLQVFVVKLDNSGLFQWAKSTTSLSGNESNAVFITESNNVYLTGQYSGTVDFDPGIDEFELTAVGGKDAFILKLDENGEFIWAKSIGGALYEGSLDIVCNASEEVIITGYFNGTVDFDPNVGVFEMNAGSNDIFLLKLSSSGTLVWAKNIPGPDHDHPHSIALDEDGNIYTCGEFRGSLEFTSGGSTLTMTSGGNRDAIIFKLTESGEFIWAKSIGGTGDQIAYGISIDPFGDPVIAGSFENTIDLNPGVGEKIKTSLDDRDLFLVKLNPDGIFTWGEAFGGNYSSIPSKTHIDHLGNLYTIGYFGGTLNLDFLPNILDFTDNGDDDIFIQKIAPEYASIDEYNSSDFNIYPNPNNGLFYIDVSQFTEPVTLLIYNNFGQLVYQQEISKNKKEVQIVAKLPKGFYSINLISINQRSQQKLMINQ